MTNVDNDDHRIMSTADDDKSAINNNNRSVSMNDCDSKAGKILNIKNALEMDLEACDMKWSLFVAAASSNRYDSMLKPYPTNYQIHESNEKLIKAIAKVPSFPTILQSITESNYASFDEESIDLIHWVIVDQNDPSLKSIPRKQFKTVLNRVPSIVRGPCPTHIFEVVSKNDSVAEAKFQKYTDQTNNMKTMFAFHGSRVDNFHSILNYGLQQHLSKTSLFGEGIYLSSEMHVSLTFSPNGAGWERSICGNTLSCMAICEFIDHPKHLQYHVKDKRHENDVPDKYFIITNNDIVRLRYLVLYGKRNRPVQTLSDVPFRNPFVNWLWNHKSIVAMCFYALILILVGLMNNPSGSYYMHRFVKALKNFVHFYLGL